LSAAAFASFRMVRSEGIYAVVDVYLISYFVIGMLTLGFESRQLLSALHHETGSGGETIRFSPFSNHPNLVGHIFAGSLVFHVIYLFWVSPAQKWKRLAAAISAALALTFILAASSRGALASAGVALFVCVISRRKYLEIALKMSLVVLVASTIFSVSSGTNLVEVASRSINSTFELDSQYRGLNSGLSGRSDNWPVIYRQSTATLSGLLAGHGIRSWSDEVNGIATDSSYINMIWESGLLLTILFSFCILAKMIILRFSEPSFLTDLGLTLLCFALVESIFARYLIAIGNPASLLILLVLVGPSRLQPLPKAAASPLRPHSREIWPRTVVMAYHGGEGQSPT
jgi:exopolysaccharide production protein ExoQ